MTVAVAHPGVYIQEIPSGSRTLTGVATSITAFVGRAARGPVNEPVTVSGWGEFERAFGGLRRDSGLGYAVRDFYLNGGGQAVIVRVEREPQTATIDAGGLELAATGPGSWANPMTVTVTTPSPADAADIAEQQGIAAADLFNLEVRELGAGAPDEVFVNVTVVDGPRRVDLVLQSSRLIRATELPQGARPPDGQYAVSDDGAGDGPPPNLATYVGGGLEEAKEGLFALLKSDLFNILCIPPPIPSGSLPDGVWAPALSLCNARQAFLVVDPPAGITATDLPAWPSEDPGPALTGPATRNAALYYPRLRAADPLREGASADFAACGAIAGVMARTDATRGVWKAPAGTDAALAGASGLSLTLTDGENGALNPLGINCLRHFRVLGPVVWGARTLRGADALSDDYKYVPVRRLALFLEESLYRGTQWAVFEPNDHSLWGQIRLSIGAFMQDLFRQGAFQGASPREAYFVRCDSSTTTQYDIDRGIVNIHVGFAPLKPAEFVIITIQQKTAAADV